MMAFALSMTKKNAKEWFIQHEPDIGVSGLDTVGEYRYCHLVMLFEVGKFYGHWLFCPKFFFYRNVFIRTGTRYYNKTNIEKSLFPFEIEL